MQFDSFDSTSTRYADRQVALLADQEETRQAKVTMQIEVRRECETVMAVERVRFRHEIVKLQQGCKEDLDELQATAARKMIELASKISLSADSRCEMAEQRCVGRLRWAVWLIG